MRKALGVSIVVLGALLSSVSAQASGKISVTTAIAGTTTASVLAFSTVTVTLCSTNNGGTTCPALPNPLAVACPVITLKNGPQTIKASCSTGFKPTAFNANIVVIGVTPAVCSAAGLIGTSSNTATCGGVTVKIGK